MQTMTTEAELALTEALEAFKIASGRLLTAWDHCPGDAVAEYPRFMPSFDEAALAFAQMRVRPSALTHDQLQGLARLADDLSKGSHGSPVASVAVALQRDGLADVHVNGERQDFRMDAYGHPVDAR